MSEPMHARVRAAVQGYYDALDADALDEVLDYFAGDVLYRRGGYDPIVGLERLRAYYSTDRQLASGRHVLRSVLVEGNQAAAHGMFEGEKRDGSRTSVGFAAFFVFDAKDRISEHTTYFFVPAV